MADNVEIDAGSGGDTIAADDIAGVKHQRVKIEHGTDGTATDVSADAPLPVVQTGTPALPTGAATEATLADLLTELGGKLEAGQAVALDAATLAALENVTAAISGTVAVTDNAGSLTVDAPISTPVGVRLSDGTSAIGATAQRLHVDDGGSSLSVDDNGGSLTVDGTVAVSSVAGSVSADTNALGTWGYKAGTSGTPTLTGKRVLKITASAPSSASASVTINGGDTITIPAGKTFGYELRGSLTAPTVAFTGTDAYFVETIG